MSLVLVVRGLLQLLFMSCLLLFAWFVLLVLTICVCFTLIAINDPDINIFAFVGLILYMLVVL